MRYAILAAAMAASVLAVPMEKKRDVVVVTNTDVDVVYVTEYYTVTGGQAAPTEAPAPAAPANQHYGHGNPHWWGGNPNKGKHTKKPKTKTTTEEPAATWEPAPTKSKTKTKTYAPAPAPTTTKAPAPAPTNAPPATGYSGIVVQHHNFHRANHSASDIEWDQDLADTAVKIAGSCVYAHNTEMDGGGYGQNIAAGVDESGVARIITDMFYNGEVGYYAGLYGQDSPDMTNFEKWGHFSQIVWKGTTAVGCATKHCPNGLANTGADVPPYFTVCNYAKPGNYANEYGSNVGEPLDYPTVTGETESSW